MSGNYGPITALSLPLSGNSVILADTTNAQGIMPESGTVSLNNLSTIIGGTAIPFTASRFYGLPAGNTPGTLLTVTGTLYAYPIVIAGTATLKTIGIYSSTGQTGGAAHAGIYQDTGAGYPGALVNYGAANTSDTGALAATANTTVSTYTPTTSITLSAGIYWLASIWNATSTFPTAGAITAVYPSITASQLGFDTAAHMVATSGQAASGITVTGQTYGALPATFPTGAAAVQNAATPIVILGT